MGWEGGFACQLGLTGYSSQLYAPPTSIFQSNSSIFFSFYMNNIIIRRGFSKALDKLQIITLSLRVGLVLQVWRHPDSVNLYCQKIDIGEDMPRLVASALQKEIPIQEISGKVIVLSNIKARKLGGFQSNGMLLCAVNKQGLIKLLKPSLNAKIGQLVKVQGLQENYKQKQQILNPKKKIVERLQNSLKTDCQGVVRWEDKRLLVGGDCLRSQLKDAVIR